jgi:hypothetical protein
MPRFKEPDFFVAERNWRRGRAWYESLFEGAGQATAVGEASTTYSMFPTYGGVPERIHALLPDIRLIYLVRHPIERMRSDYLHYANPPRRARFMTRERRPIEEALLVDRRYADASRYAAQVERYLEWFPREQTLVITSEGLRQEREATVRRVYGFIGVDQAFTPPAIEEEHNATARASRAVDRALHRSPMGRSLLAVTPAPVRRVAGRLATKPIETDVARISDELRGELEDRLRDDVRRLRSYIDGDFDGWGIG